jgi:hypothetical protein
MTENMMKFGSFLSILCLVALTSCDSNQVHSLNQEELVVEEPAELVEEITFFQFTPDTSDFTLNPQVVAEYAYQLDTLTIVAGHDPITDCGQFIVEDTVNGWGDRLYVLNAEEEILFKSAGVGDYYLFQPHFYKNDVNDQVMIVCQLGFEYFDGGEVFLFENGEVKYLGYINVSGPDMDTGLSDILNIQSKGDEFFFSFTGDSILFSPGSGDPEFMGSSDINYRYAAGELSVLR